MFGLRHRWVLLVFSALAAFLWCNIWLGIESAPLRHFSGHSTGAVCRLTENAEGKGTYGRAEGILLEADGKPIRRKVEILLRDASPHERAGDRLSGEFVVKRIEKKLAAGKIQKGFLYQIEQSGPITAKHTDKMPLVCRAALWREKIAGLMNRVYPKREAALQTALLTGEKSGFTAEELRQLRLSGTAHIAAVSGMHIAIVCMALAVIFGKRAGLLLAIPAACGYALLAGLTPSALRAAIMAILGGGAFFFKEEKDAVNTLAAAALILLLFRPIMVFDAGFLLSFGATLGILMFLPRMEVVLRRVFPTRRFKDRLLHGVGSAVCVSLSAQVFTFPLSCLMFQSISVVTLLTNVLIAPLLIFAVLGGFLLLAANTFSLGAAKAVSLAVYPVLKLVSFFQQTAVRLPYYAVSAKSVYVRFFAITLVIFFLLWYAEKITARCLRLGLALTAVCCVGAAAAEFHYFPSVSIANCGGSALLSYEEAGKIEMVVSGDFYGDSFYACAQQLLEEGGENQVERLLLTTKDGIPFSRRPEDKWAKVKKTAAPQGFACNWVTEGSLKGYGASGRLGQGKAVLSLLGKEPYACYLRFYGCGILSGCGVLPKTMLETVKKEKITCDVLVLDAAYAKDPAAAAQLCKETKARTIFCMQPVYRGEEFTLGQITTEPVVYLPNRGAAVLKSYGSR